jgi:hypothetical protein
MEEVATMGTNELMRPSMLLTAACAPSALSAAVVAPVVTQISAAAPVLAAQVLAVPVLAAPVLAAERARVSRVHQVQSQAELALTVLVPTGGRINEINGTTGFMGLGSSVDANGSAGSNDSAGSKQYGDERGIPPRGRPV